jgi:hypothetical protein
VIQREAANFAALSRTSKLIHAETTPLFYTRNTFLLSYGVYASPHAANTPALKYFVSKSKDGLKLIQNLVLELPFGINLNAYESDIRGMKAIARRLSEHFSGVTSVLFEIRDLGLDRNTYRAERAVTTAQSKATLEMIVRIVLRAKELREVRWLKRQRPFFGDLDVLVEKVMKRREIPEDKWVKVLVVEGEKRERVRCNERDLMREQNAEVPA